MKNNYDIPEKIAAFSDVQALIAIADEFNSRDNGYYWTANANEWENYGKHRIYLDIVETRGAGSKHYKKMTYGYIDLDTCKYVPGNNKIA